MPAVASPVSSEALMLPVAPQHVSVSRADAARSAAAARSAGAAATQNLVAERRHRLNKLLELGGMAVSPSFGSLKSERSLRAAGFPAGAASARDNLFLPSPVLRPLEGSASFDSSASSVASTEAAPVCRASPSGSRHKRHPKHCHSVEQRVAPPRHQPHKARLRRAKSPAAPPTDSAAVARSSTSSSALASAIKRAMIQPPKRCYTALVKNLQPSKFLLPQTKAINFEIPSSSGTCESSSWSTSCSSAPSGSCAAPVVSASSSVGATASVVASSAEAPEVDRAPEGQQYRGFSSCVSEASDGELSLSAASTLSAGSLTRLDDELGLENEPPILKHANAALDGLFVVPMSPSVMRLLPSPRQSDGAFALAFDQVCDEHDLQAATAGATVTPTRTRQGQELTSSSDAAATDTSYASSPPQLFSPLLARAKTTPGGTLDAHNTEAPSRRCRRLYSTVAVPKANKGVKDTARAAGCAPLPGKGKIAAQAAADGATQRPTSQHVAAPLSMTLLRHPISQKSQAEAASNKQREIKNLLHIHNSAPTHKHKVRLLREVASSIDVDQLLDGYEDVPSEGAALRHSHDAAGLNAKVENGHRVGIVSRPTPSPVTFPSLTRLLTDQHLMHSSDSAVQSDRIMRKPSVGALSEDELLADEEEFDTPEDTEWSSDDGPSFVTAADGSVFGGSPSSAAMADSDEIGTASSFVLASVTGGNDSKLPYNDDTASSESTDVQQYPSISSSILLSPSSRSPCAASTECAETTSSPLPSDRTNASTPSLSVSPYDSDSMEQEAMTLLKTADVETKSSPAEASLAAPADAALAVSTPAAAIVLCPLLQAAATFKRSPRTSPLPAYVDPTTLIDCSLLTNIQGDAIFACVKNDVTPSQATDALHLITERTFSRCMVGRWETLLCRSDSLDPLFKQFGIQFFKRMVVDKLAIPLTVTMEGEDDTWLHVVVHLPVGNRHMHWALDGSESEDDDPDCGTWLGKIHIVDHAVPWFNDSQPFKAMQQIRIHPKIGTVHETRAVLPDATHGRILYLNYTLYPRKTPNQPTEVVRILKPLSAN
eukprot:GHVT01005323.1.p1 GENE.GHVT01005323.1~~GHVT01005323.1.p1  ORF type:complete len:1056 (+),score=234.72 GHVT01005323.1:2007-5174(+)